MPSLPKMQHGSAQKPSKSACKLDNEWSTTASGPSHAPSSNGWRVRTCLLVACLLALFFLERQSHHWYGTSILTDISDVLQPQHYQDGHRDSGASSSANTSRAPLQCFQVHQPIWTPSGWTTQTKSKHEDCSATSDAASYGSESCSVLLMEHSFGFSYGHPFIGKTQVLDI
jgi:hypothetical protein